MPNGWHRRYTPSQMMQLIELIGETHRAGQQRQGFDAAFGPIGGAMGAQNRRCNPTSNLEVLVDADLDTLATELYVRTDDLLKGRILA